MKKHKVVSLAWVMMMIVLLALTCRKTKMVYAEGEDGGTGNGMVKHRLILGSDYEEVTVEPGKTTSVKIPIKKNNPDPMNSIVVNVSISGSAENSNKGFMIRNVRLRKDNNMSDLQSIDTGVDPTYVCFDVVTKDTIGIGTYYFDISFESILGEEFQCNTLHVPFHVSKELRPAELTVDKYTYNEDKALVGHKLDLQIRVKNEGEIDALNSYLSIDYGTSGIVADYSTKSIKLGDINKTQSVSFKVPVKILSTATTGLKELKATISYKDASGNSFSTSAELYITVSSSEKAPKLVISSVKYPRELKQGKEFKVSFDLENTGKSTAYKILASVEGLGSDSVLPSYTSETIEAEELVKGEKEEVKVPLIVSKTATAGAKTIVINLTYEDEEDISYTTKTTIYPEVIVEEKKEEEKKEEEEIKPTIIVSNVQQTPSIPEAGGQVTLSFDLVNKSNQEIREVKIGPSNIAANTFSPDTSDPYEYIDKLAAHSSMRFTRTFSISKQITEGLNTVEMQYSYVYGKKSVEGTGSAILNVVNVKNEEEKGVTIPKLIISNYSTDVDDLRAGKTFVFSYDIKNTSTTTNAKNIKVTISQADNIFNITSGSNSFFIDRIGAGETYSTEIELKVKADATTKAYPLDITLEYDYEGATANPTTGEIGENVKNTINLQAVENTRPEVDNIGISDWNQPVVNEPTTLSLEFYNMGKSALNNVCIRISGDFQKQDGEKYFVGNVQSGSSEYVEMNVIPLVEGTASGVVHITFEDSNGEEQTLEKEFSVDNIQGSMVPDMFPGDMDPDMMEGMNEEKVKKEIVPMWAFILGEVVIFLVVILIVRAIVIKRYKKKMEREEMED